MRVVATAGHVDHGKSTLVRALTGIDPDRWAEERRRGLTIDLGFAWTDIGAETIAFVDVPGHERFVTNMLAGVGPVPAVLLVVAADEGWMPQTEEHVAALDALGVSHALVAVSRADLADPAAAIAQARDRLATTTMDGAECVAVSAPTDRGVRDLSEALSRLVGGLPAPDLDAPVRLWVDRSFSIRGAGTVVTGTLTAGRIGTDGELELNGRPVTVRRVESTGRPVEVADAVARVALNLRGVDPHDVRRGDAVLTPGTWQPTDVVDIRLCGPDDVPAETVLHVGSAAVPVRARPLGSGFARLTLRRQLPLALGDRALLRDPGRHRVVAGVTVLDVRPPALRRRGAAAARGLALSHPDGASELRRRGLAQVGDLRRAGLEVAVAPLVDDWAVDPELADRLRAQLRAEVHDYAAAHPLESGPPVDALRHRLGLPDRALVEALLTPPLVVRDGRVADAGRPGLPPAIAAAVGAVADDLRARPYAAPDAARLTELGLGAAELAAAERAGALLRLPGGVVLLPGADTAARDLLAALPQPFSVSEARQALGTTRRVALPLLELLDRKGVTRRGPDDRRVVSG